MPQKRQTAVTEINDTDGLRKVLVEAINKLRLGDIDTKTATAITGLANAIVQTAKVDLAAAEFIRESGVAPKSQRLTLK